MYEAITSTQFDLAEVQVHKGKVRDVYSQNDTMAVVTTDRISAFDVILPRAIPFKGQVLNEIADYFFQSTRDIIPSWLEAIPDSNIAVGKKCDPYPVEVIVRGYLAGHAWRVYKSGSRSICGIPLPEGLKQNDQLPSPILTPSTKAEEGHDEDISVDEILSRGLINKEDWSFISTKALELYKRGSEMAQKRGLILVDTKYEFGKYGNDILLIDEVHTPDSSRYFYREEYQDRQSRNEPQKQLSKEFVREWLMENNFQGREGDILPEMSDSVVQKISNRYIELFEKITGRTFQPRNYENVNQTLYLTIKNYFNQ